MRDFRQLKVWRRAHELTKALYRATARFPMEERFGLSNQIRRAMASVPTNIAEGCARTGRLDYARFLNIGYSSLSEVDYMVLLSYELGYIDAANYKQLYGEIQEIQRMLYTLEQRLRQKT